MRYIYYANSIIELLHEKQDRDPNFIIEVPDEFELEPNMAYSVNSETGELISFQKNTESV